MMSQTIKKTLFVIIIATYAVISSLAQELNSNDLILNKFITKDGFYCNGVYENRDDPNMLSYYEPLDKLNFNSFAISCYFKVSEVRRQSVFVLGRSCRLLALRLNRDQTISLEANNYDISVPTTKKYELNKWYLAVVTFSNGKASVFFDTQKICEKHLQLTPDCVPTDNTLTSVNYGNGTGFKGNVRELKVYNLSLSGPILVQESSKEKRLADYIYGGTLANPINDANSMYTALTNLGFTVIKNTDSDQKLMKRAIDEFGNQLKNYDVALFFYAGHGIQVKGNNYLIPIDAKLENENDVEYNCVRASRVLAKMEGAGTKTNIIVLDACRDNPFERSWNRSSGGKGLAFMNAPSGSLIAYATSPGNTASDGKGKNGLYTSALLKYLTHPILQLRKYLN
jgi:hypothetical protein